MTSAVRIFLLWVAINVMGIVLAKAQDGHGMGKPAGCVIRGPAVSFGWTNIPDREKWKLPAKNGQLKLPLRYAAYSINGKKLRAFLMETKEKPSASYKITLPSPEGSCLVFGLSPSGTLSPELAAKFPELVSLKGTSEDDKNAYLRLDYNGRELNAEITRMGKIYLIAPWKKGKQTYYLVYKKEDAVTEKKPFAPY